MGNEQVICNLLHLAVQLAIFGGPKCTTEQSTEPPSEAEQRRLGWKADATCQETPAAAEVSTQTVPAREARARSMERPEKTIGVRIGGGYHVVQHVKESSGKQNAKRVQSASRERFAQYRNDETIHSSYEGHPFAHGAAPEGMPASRFHVASLSAANPDHPLPEQLYRVLQPVGHQDAAQGSAPPATPTAPEHGEAAVYEGALAGAVKATAPTLLEMRQRWSQLCDTTAIKLVPPGRLRPSSAGQIRAQPTGQARPRSATCLRNREAAEGIF